MSRPIRFADMPVKKKDDSDTDLHPAISRRNMEKSRMLGLDEDRLSPSCFRHGAGRYLSAATRAARMPLACPWLHGRDFTYT
jgi:hypothetical protein